MNTAISCPHCSRKVDIDERTCKHCGVDLGIAAAFAESDIELPTGAPVKPEVLVPRLGDYLVQSGKLSLVQLNHALDYQAKCSKAGKPILIGQALRELNFIDAETLDQVITEQILQLQNALQESNRNLERRVKERTRELRKTLARLSEINALKSNFISNISHELRTPLTHMKGYLEILAGGDLGELNPDQSEVLSIIQKAEVRLERLIEDLIQFSLASKGKLKLNIKRVEVYDLLKTSLRESLPKAKAKDIQISTSITERLPNVYCDGEKINWVITQFLDNAIKFTPKGGLVNLQAYQLNGYVTIIISDNGIGVAEDVLQDIFEPFHQVDGSTTRLYGGTGLGLALSKRILAAHGADIEVRSKLGEGSSFRFSLPKANPLTEH